MDPDLRRSQMGLGLQEDVGIPTVPDAARVVETAPVKEPQTPGEWIHQNLFSGPFNTILTILAGSFAIYAIYQLIGFLFGSEWTVVQRFMKLFMTGPFPIEETWRIWACTYFIALLAGLSWGMTRRRMVLTPRRAVLAVGASVFAVVIVLYTVQTTLVRLLALGAVVTVLAGVGIGRLIGPSLRRPLIAAWLLAFPVVVVVVLGFGGVTPRLWGGFFFNIIAATVGIFASFPIGIALALGRKSELPAVRTISIVVIEVFRGVPLVAWLIASKYVVDLVLPPQVNLPDIVKAFIAMTMFSAAYVAEIVRGGLQGVHEGQYEAARAIGLKTTRMMAFVVMPQALRSTIPAMISHFISLFKDTSLFAAIQVTDLLAGATRAPSHPDFQLTEAQTLGFAALLFWVVAFSMSRWSQRLELRVGVGER